MQMEMKNGLARATAIVEHRAIAFQQLALARRLRRHKLQFPEYGLIFRTCVRQ